MAYIKKILNTWHTAGVTNLEQLETHRKSHKGQAKEISREPKADEYADLYLS